MNALRSFLTEYSITDLSVPAVHLRDIIDIIIVTFLVYNILLWIKETRAWTLFKGIIFILGFALVSLVFNLSTILFILKHSFNVAIMAVIVIFQPELRKVLEQIGKGHFLSNIFPSGMKENEEEKTSLQAMEEVIKAVTKMAAAKTGALILIQQEVPLGDHERTGIPIDSMVSSQLLINIFEHNTPLHDGAVIIKNNRIAAATCFLPLTERNDISMDLGTRHRAALGASEVSDAYVLVVSEETGAISLAKDGMLHRNVSPEYLRDVLLNQKKYTKKKLQLWKGRGSK